jgi:hypothetical protein
MATELEHLQRDANTLIESLRHDWRDITDISKPAGEREGIRVHIDWCLAELRGLWEEIEAIDA